MRLFAFLALFFWASIAVAVEPSEMLSDTVLELRAQHLDDIIRCVQCRSENIASSNADWARDARLLVREMISAGATDQEVLDRFVRAYGDVVLMKPPSTGWNVLLWIAGPILMCLVCFGFIQKFRTKDEDDTELTETERQKLDQIMKDTAS